MSERGPAEDRLRPVFTCVVCGCAYLPPKSMEYQAARPASPLHCGGQACRDRCAQLPPRLRALMARAAWARARQWAEREPAALPERARRRAGRAGRIGRPQGRFKLR
ncbi:hypothetical protein GCM10018779_52080 [Streptomyces griseocarneus]|nr:hypothetical protein GCM10018779_52080 [Streptomyces griseocarneus]